MYTDEDSGERAWVDSLRSSGFDVLTANQAGTTGLSDQDHLSFAARSQRAIISQNVGHFHALHTQLMSSGSEHWGIILIHQHDRLGPGEVARRLKVLASMFSRSELRNQLVYLGVAFASSD
ncbi:MAG: DUF5615 family PIN-like protein [Dehalococcoidia bacterium]